MPSRSLLIGIDSGTQSTKALVVDARTGAVLGEGAAKYGLIPDLPPGAKEQHPEVWIQAMVKSVRAALKAARASASEVVALGVSGQQHGFVPLDAQGEVIRPAKLWCATSTAAECEEITAALGGTKAVIKAIMLAQSQAEADPDAALRDTVGTYYKTTMEAAKLAASKQPIMIDQRKNKQFILDRGQSMKELGYVKKLAPAAAIDWTLLEQVIAENKALYAGLKLKSMA